MSCWLRSRAGFALLFWLGACGSDGSAAQGDAAPPSDVVDAGAGQSLPDSSALEQEGALCRNGQLDESEGDIDCGGPCKPCAERALCNESQDCAPGLECLLPVRPGDGTLHPAPGAWRAVIQVELDTGHRSVVSSATTLIGVRGTGPALLDPTGIALDESRNLAFIVDKQRKALIRVDLEAGNRTVVSDDADDDGTARGTGPAFMLASGVAIDAVGNQAFVADFGLKAVVRVDLQTGDRSVLSDQDDAGVPRGTGPGFSRPVGIAIHVPSARAFVVDQYNEAVFAVDLGTGNRVLASRVTF